MSETQPGWPVAATVQTVEPVAAPTPEEVAERKAAAAKAWLESIEPKKQWEAYEKLKRAEVTALFFPTPVKGTQRQPLASGGNLKLVHGLTYTLGDKELVDPTLGEKVPVETQVEGVLEAIEQLGNEGPFLAKRLVKWKPELSETEYKLLGDENASEAQKEAKKLIDSILTVKPASPQLAFEPPKAPA